MAFRRSAVRSRSAPPTIESVDDAPSEFDFVLTGAQVKRTDSETVLDRGNVLFRCAFATCVASALVLIWAHRFLPISDYPDWVFEGSIVANLLRGNPQPSYSFKHYPVPYTATVAFLGLLDLVFSPETSGKILLTLCILLIAVSSTYLLKSFQRGADNPIVSVPLVFLLNTFFFWGELTYLLGLSVFFVYCGYLFRRFYRSESINWCLIGVASIALFFSHFIPYAAAILVTVVLLLAESRVDLFKPFVVAFAPSLGLTVWYAIERLSSGLNASMWQFWTLHQMAGRLIAAFSPFPEFLPWLGINSPWMKMVGVLNLLVSIALALIVPLCVFLWAKGCRPYKGVFVCTVVCACAVIVTGYEFAGMVSPGERFLYPVVWIGLTWLIGASIPRRGSVFGRWLTGVMITLIAGQIIFLQMAVGSVSNDLAVLYSKLRSARSQTDFCAIYERYLRESYDQPHRRGLDLLLTNHSSAVRLPYYIYLEDKVDAPIFQIGPLDYKGPGDNEDLCKDRGR
jgi:hypothetical protein